MDGRCACLVKPVKSFRQRVPKAQNGIGIWPCAQMSMVSEVVYRKSLLLDGIYIRRHELSKDTKECRTQPLDYILRARLWCRLATLLPGPCLGCPKHANARTVGQPRTPFCQPEGEIREGHTLRVDCYAVLPAVRSRICHH